MDNFFSEYDSYLFHHGTHYELYNKMGSHLIEKDGVSGVQFVLWADNARDVCIISDGNGWTPWRDNMERTDGGIWQLFIPGMTAGTKYKYLIRQVDGSETEKTDPYGFFFEKRPANSTIVIPPHEYVWGDSCYKKINGREELYKGPMAIYEVHLGSWKKDRNSHDEDRFMNYRTLAHQLSEYIQYMGYTHIELMGICEYPYDLSWGYQVTGYFAPTSRYGSPDDFRYFVDHMHKCGIGVILDWVPAHFPKDSHSLGRFDGTPMYEPADTSISEYPEWGTYAFDHSKNEVKDFLISSALFWIKEYHIDALRVDAVCSMLYRNFSRPAASTIIYGGYENLDSIEFLKHLGSVIERKSDGYLIAEDSSIIPGVTKEADNDGLGFTFKWDMGWMNDTLKYIGKEPIYRKYHHSLMTHTTDYVYDEHYILVLSHDEVVYGKGTMYSKIPGDVLERIGCLKTYYTMMFGHPGKKLLFMGQDFAMINEWDCKKEIDWYLADDGCHRDVMETVRSLLSIYRSHRILYNDFGDGTIEYISSLDSDRSIFSFIRKNKYGYKNALYFVCNFTPTERKGYAMGLPESGKYKMIFSTYNDCHEDMIYSSEHILCDGREERLPFDLRAYESVIFEKIAEKD